MDRTAGRLARFNKRYLIALVLVILPMFLLGLGDCILYIHGNGIFPEYYLNALLFFSVAFIIILMLLAIILVQNLGRAVAAEVRLEQSLETLRGIEQLFYSVRKQRHDFNHHLQTVYGLLETGYHAQAREYLQQTFTDISATSALFATDNLPVSALLYTKIGVAQTRNIRMEVTVECSLKNLPLKSRDTNSLLGNLVDNAVDAVEHLPADQRKVGVKITRERGRYTFIVTNGSTAAPPLPEDIFTPSVTTKAGHDGLGLAIVKKIVDLYRGEITVRGGAQTAVTVVIPTGN